MNKRETEVRHGRSVPYALKRGVEVLEVALQAGGHIPAAHHGILRLKVAKLDRQAWVDLGVVHLRVCSKRHNTICHICAALRCTVLHCAARCLVLFYFGRDLLGVWAAND